MDLLKNISYPQPLPDSMNTVVQIFNRVLTYVLQISMVKSLKSFFYHHLRLCFVCLLPYGMGTGPTRLQLGLRYDRDSQILLLNI